MGSKGQRINLCFFLITYFHALNTTEIYIRIVQAPWTSSVLEVTRGICRTVGLGCVVGLDGEREKDDRRRVVEKFWSFVVS